MDVWAPQKVKLVDFTFGHMEQFVDLWARMQNIVLLEDMEDVIPNGSYSAVSAYKAQFYGVIGSDMKKMCKLMEQHEWQVQNANSMVWDSRSVAYQKNPIKKW